MTAATGLSFVLDMNVSPEWAKALTSLGYDAVHWSAVGDPNATDEAIMAWARLHGRVVFTLDLDFGIILALTHQCGPSVLQARVESSLPEAILPLIRAAISEHSVALTTGALLTVDEVKSRVRILPF